MACHAVKVPGACAGSAEPLLDGQQVLCCRGWRSPRSRGRAWRSWQQRCGIQKQAAGQVARLRETVRQVGHGIDAAQAVGDRARLGAERPVAVAAAVVAVHRRQRRRSAAGARGRHAPGAASRTCAAPAAASPARSPGGSSPASAAADSRGTSPSSPARPTPPQAAVSPGRRAMQHLQDVPAAVCEPEHAGVAPGRAAAAGDEHVAEHFRVAVEYEIARQHLQADLVRLRGTVSIGNSRVAFRRGYGVPPTPPSAAHGFSCRRCRRPGGFSRSPGPLAGRHDGQLELLRRSASTARWSDRRPDRGTGRGSPRPGRRRSQLVVAAIEHGGDQRLFQLAQLAIERGHRLQLRLDLGQPCGGLLNFFTLPSGTSGGREGAATGRRMKVRECRGLCARPDRPGRAGDPVRGSRASQGTRTAAPAQEGAATLQLAWTANS